MKNTKLSNRIKVTLSDYSISTCIEAYKANIDGCGGNTVGEMFGEGISSMSRNQITYLGDRLIDAGKYLVENRGFKL
jgi:hypothetical protein